MKVFIGACAALILVIALVIFAAFYVSDAMDELDKKAENMPIAITNEEETDIARKHAESIRAYWNDHSFAVNLCISQRESEYIELAVSKMFAALDSGDGASYAEALATFRHYVGHLKEEEEFSARNIL